MGSVKDPVIGKGLGSDLYILPTVNEFGRVAWKVKGEFSVADLKSKIEYQKR